jgi:hypothetical protein
MTVRTTKKAVTFARPFILGKFDGVFPAGTYDVETDEELLENLSFCAYRRVLTVIHLPVKSGRRGRAQTLTIDPNELDAALKRDAAWAAIPVSRRAVQVASMRTTMARQKNDDRQSVDRAENEGMIASSR